jgi:L-cysteine S-thiosulfotransferase
MHPILKKCLLALSLGILSTSYVWAQKSATDSIAEYREMLQDGNPAELFEIKGEDLWKQKRGPNNVSLEMCDLGKGPGVVKGAWVEMPRFFADTARVQDLESRLLTCMEKLQGFDASTIAKTAYGTGEQSNLTALATWIASESQGMKFNVPQGHIEEKKMYEVGKRLFYMRAGTHDFGCSTCHGDEGRRIRLQDLAQLNVSTGAKQAYGTWPAYRVSNGQMWGMQQRLNDCYRQQRFPYLKFASDASIALEVFMGVNAKGGEAAAPAIKR